VKFDNLDKLYIITPIASLLIGLSYNFGLFFAIDFRLIQLLNYNDFLMSAIYASPITIILFLNFSSSLIGSEKYHGRKMVLSKKLIVCTLIWATYLFITSKPSYYPTACLMVLALFADFFDTNYIGDEQGRNQIMFERAVKIAILCGFYLFIKGYSSFYSTLEYDSYNYKLCAEECKNYKLFKTSNEYYFAYDDSNKSIVILRKSDILYVEKKDDRVNVPIFDIASRISSIIKSMQNKSSDNAEVYRDFHP